MTAQLATGRPRRPWQTRWTAARSWLPVVVGGLLVAAPTMLVIGPAILSAQIRDSLCGCPAIVAQAAKSTAALHYLNQFAPEAGWFAMLATIGQVLGVWFISPIGDSVNRRAFVFSLATAASALVVTLPYVHGTGARLLVMFLVGLLLPIEPLVRPLVGLAFPDIRRSEVQAFLTFVFVSGLFGLRFPMTLVVGPAGDPWRGLVVGAGVLMLLIAVGAVILPLDTAPRQPLAYRQTMRELWRTAERPTILWAAVFGGIPGAGQAVTDGAVSDLLADHGVSGLNSWFGAPALVGGVTAFLYAKYGPKSRRRMLLGAFAMILAAYTLMIPAAGLSGGTFAAALMATDILVYVGSNMAVPATITAATATTTSVWVAGRILGLAGFNQVGAVAYGHAQFAGTITVGLAVTVIGLALTLARGHWLDKSDTPAGEFSLARAGTQAEGFVPFAIFEHPALGPCLSVSGEENSIRDCRIELRTADGRPVGRIAPASRLRIAIDRLRALADVSGLWRRRVIRLEGRWVQVKFTRGVSARWNVSPESLLVTITILGMHGPDDGSHIVAQIFKLNSAPAGGRLRERWESVRALLRRDSVRLVAGAALAALAGLVFLLSSRHPLALLAASAAGLVWAAPSVGASRTGGIASATFGHLRALGLATGAGLLGLIAAAAGAVQMLTEPAEGFARDDRLVAFGLGLLTATIAGSFVRGLWRLLDEADRLAVRCRAALETARAAALETARASSSQPSAIAGIRLTARPRGTVARGTGSALRPQETIWAENGVDPKYVKRVLQTEVRELAPDQLLVLPPGS